MTGDAVTDEILTPRQREIAELLAAGHSERQCARILGISPLTVRAHCRTLHYRLPGDGSVRTRVVAWLAAQEREAS